MRLAARFLRHSCRRPDDPYHCLADGLRLHVGQLWGGWRPCAVAKWQRGVLGQVRAWFLLVLNHQASVLVFVGILSMSFSGSLHVCAFLFPHHQAASFSTEAIKTTVYPFIIRGGKHRDPHGRDIARRFVRRLGGLVEKIKVCFHVRE